MLKETYHVGGIGPTLQGRNGGGDRYFTDGEVTIGVLSENAAPSAAVPPMLPDPPAIAAKNGVWQWLKRFL
jgi:hypothetical protein